MSADGDLIERLRKGALRAYRDQAEHVPVTCPSWSRLETERRAGSSYCLTESGDGHRCRFRKHDRSRTRCSCLCRGVKWDGSGL